MEAEKIRVEKTNLAPSAPLNAMLTSLGTSPLSTGCKVADLIRRPQIGVRDLAPFDPERPDLPDAVLEQVEIQIKYAGYIERQNQAVEEARRLDGRLLPQDMDYTQVRGLRLEAAEKLSKIRPLSIGQASRISGVSPADIAVLLVWLAQNQEDHHAAGV